MSVIIFPNSLAVSKFSIGPARQDMSFVSIFGSQGVEVNDPLWSVVLEGDTETINNEGEWTSLIMKLRGQTNQLEVWNIGRPAPVGTMRGSMLTTAPFSMGDTSLTFISSGQAGGTLVVGDMIGFGSGTTKQLVMVTSGGTANSSGSLSVAFEPPSRSNVASGSALYWDKPTALFRQVKGKQAWKYENIVINGFTLELIEDTRA